MIIQRKDLRTMAANFLATIEREDISTLDELQGRLNERISVDEDKRAFILIEYSHPPLGTPCIALSYVLPDVVGIPIEFRLRGRRSPESHAIVKCSNQVPSYTARGEDTFGNLIQNKVLSYIEFSGILKELELLRNL